MNRRQFLVGCAAGIAGAVGVKHSTPAVYAGWPKVLTSGVVTFTHWNGGPNGSWIPLDKPIVIRKAVRLIHK